MKVAIYAGMYKKNQDGATKSLYQLTDSLLIHKIDVGIWAFSLTHQNKKGLSLFKVPSIPLYFYPEYRCAFPSYKMKKQLKTFKPDLIHIAAPDLVGILTVIYAKRKNIPIVMSYHTDFPSYLKSYKIDFLKKMIWRFFKWFYNEANTVFVPTQEVAHELIEKGIKNIKIWSRGINRMVFHPRFGSKTLRSQWRAIGKKVILYSGRLVWYKDLKTFIEVYRLCQKNHPNDFTFVLLGTGPIESELKNSMSDAIFPGYLNGKVLSEAYASADILLFPSTTEAFGNVIQESLSSGTPVVVSDIGGCQEIVNNSKGGLIAKAKDADSFYKCCLRLLFDKYLYKRLRKKGLKYARNRTWEKINNVVISEYYKLCGKPRLCEKKSDFKLHLHRLIEYIQCIVNL